MFFVSRNDVHRCTRWCTRWLGVGRWNFRISVERRPRLRSRRIRAFFTRLTAEKVDNHGSMRY
jgi:hypothetical protein